MSGLAGYQLRTSTDGTVSVMQLAVPYDMSAPETTEAVEAVRVRSRESEVEVRLR